MAKIRIGQNIMDKIIGLYSNIQLSAKNKGTCEKNGKERMRQN